MKMGKNRHPVRRQRGISMLETMAALFIAALVLGWVANMITQSLDDTRDQQTAQIQSDAAASLNQAIKLNYATLEGQIPVGSSTVAMTLNQLLQANFLPQTYANSRNAFGQSLCLLLQQPVAGQVDALLITTGGTAIPDKDISYIAANAGSGGGLIRSSNPASATGAFSSWSAPLATWNTQSCQGTPGHLANQLFRNGPGNQSTDFLYRNAVPGRPDLNTMSVPIGLPVVTIGAACTSPTATSSGVATDATQHMVTCIDNVWTATSWREPVQNLAVLSGPDALQGTLPGETRVTLDTKLPYTWNGTKWAAVAVDNNGALNLPKAVVDGAACGLDIDNVAQPNASQIGVDETGLILSCVKNVWTATAVILPGPTDSGCQIVMPASTSPAQDYPTCSPYNGQGYSLASDHTATYVIQRPVTLTQAGLITISTYGHMNYAQCGQTGWQGQFSQSVELFAAGSSVALGQTQSQTPKMTDDSSGVTLSLNEAEPKGSYVVEIDTNFVTFSGNFGNFNEGQKWVSNFCVGSTVFVTTPVVAGWTIDTLY